MLFLVIYKMIIKFFSDIRASSDIILLFTDKNITNKDASDGRESVIEWSANKKIDSYFKFHIELRMDIFRWLNKRGEITLRFKGYLEKDYKGHFEKYGKFGTFVRSLYEEFVIKEKITSMKKKVHFETSELIDEAKKILTFTTR